MEKNRLMLEDQKNQQEEIKQWPDVQKQFEEEKAKYGPNADRFHVPPDLDKPPCYGWEDVIKNIRNTIKSMKGTSEDPADLLDIILSQVSWMNKVRQGGEWDFKVSRKDYPADMRERAGNINYGATCVAAGYDPDICLRMGGVVQGLTDIGYPKSRVGLPSDPSGENSCYGDKPDDYQDVL